MIKNLRIENQWSLTPFIDCAVMTLWDRAGGEGGVDTIDASAIRRLLLVRPEAEVDGLPASEASLTSRLSSMWLSSEPVVYVGLAGTSLAKRVGQYYRTPLGARSPHAGGCRSRPCPSSTNWLFTLRRALIQLGPKPRWSTPSWPACRRSLRHRSTTHRPRFRSRTSCFREAERRGTGSPACRRRG